MIKDLKYLDLNKPQWYEFSKNEMTVWHQFTDNKELEYTFIEKEKRNLNHITPDKNKSYNKDLILYGLFELSLKNYEKNKNVILSLLKYQPHFKKAFLDRAFKIY